MSDLTLEELSALVGDDVEFWLSNPFAARDDIAAKVCRWASKVRAAEKAAREEAEAREGNERAQAGWEKARADKAEQERDEAHKQWHLRTNKAEARVAALESGINAVVESVDALNDGGWTDLIAGAFDKFSRDLRALTEKGKP